MHSGGKEKLPETEWGGIFERNQIWNATHPDLFVQYHIVQP